MQLNDEINKLKIVKSKLETLSKKSIKPTENKSTGNKISKCDFFITQINILLKKKTEDVTLYRDMRMMVERNFQMTDSGYEPIEFSTATPEDEFPLLISDLSTILCDELELRNDEIKIALESSPDAVHNLELKRDIIKFPLEKLLEIEFPTKIADHIALIREIIDAIGSEKLSQKSQKIVDVLLNSPQKKPSTSSINNNNYGVIPRKKAINFFPELGFSRGPQKEQEHPPEIIATCTKPTEDDKLADELLTFYL